MLSNAKTRAFTLTCVVLLLSCADPDDTLRGEAVLSDASECLFDIDCPRGSRCDSGICRESVAQTPDDGSSNENDNQNSDDGSSPPSDDTTITRIVAIGDTGKANAGQKAVADAIGAHCDALGGCDAMLMLGDNFYPDGVVSIDDPQWQTAFEYMYGDLGIPVWAALGNHDYGNLTFEWFRGPVQVAYADQSDVFNMPDVFYTVRFNNVGVVVLDTDALMWDRTEFGDQRDWYSDAVSELSTDWIFVIGHHPYRSNGPHGNAGRYEDLPGLPIVSGIGVKSFFDEYVCGTADLYLSGHDHSRQWLEDPWCGTELVVSGAGATTTDLREDRNRYHWQDADRLGFLYLEIQGRRLKGQFIDTEGNVEFTRGLER
ncbi:MAG: metallophosphoesterase [Myxococcota bacterium]